MRGDLIQLSGGSSYTLRDALGAYENAVELDPHYSQAWESIGYYCDVHDQNFERAEFAFRRAVELGAGATAYVGVARVLAERNHQMTDILRFLDTCPYSDDDRVQEMRSEIESGMWEP